MTGTMRGRGCDWYDERGGAVTGRMRGRGYGW